MTNKASDFLQSAMKERPFLIFLFSLIASAGADIVDTSTKSVSHFLPFDSA